MGVGLGLQVLVHVLVDGLAAVLLVEILQIAHAAEALVVLGKHLLGLGRVCRIVGCPGEVADHLLSDCAWSLSVRLLTVFGKDHVLVHVEIVGWSSHSKIYGVVCFLACGTLYYVPSEVKLLLGTGILTTVFELLLNLVRLL